MEMIVAVYLQTARIFWSAERFIWERPVS